MLLSLFGLFLPTKIEGEGAMDCILADVFRGRIKYLYPDVYLGGVCILVMG